MSFLDLAGNTDWTRFYVPLEHARSVITFRCSTKWQPNVLSGFVLSYLPILLQSIRCVGVSQSASIRSTANRHTLQRRANRHVRQRKARLFRTVHRIRAVGMLATGHNIYVVILVGKVWRTHVSEHHGEAQRAVALGYRELRRVSGTIPKPKRVYAAFALSPSRRETRQDSGACLCICTSSAAPTTPGTTTRWRS